LQGKDLSSLLFACSFLISTPQSGVDSIAATWGMMGWPFAVLRTFFTLVTAIIAGLSVNLFCKEEESEKNSDNTATVSAPQGSLLKRFFLPGWQIMESIYTSLIIGILLAAIVGFLPIHEWVSLEVAGGFYGLLILALLGIPLYICATASIPLALAFMHQGFSWGAVFVFLLVGPATNMATALIVKKEIGGRAFVTYLFSIFFVGLAAGALINFIQLDLPKNTPGHQHLPLGGLHEIAAYLMSATVIFLFLRRFFFKKKEVRIENSFEIKVEGMTCAHCQRSVTEAIEALPETTHVFVDLEKGYASVKGASLEDVKAAVNKAGFRAP
jgi:copper chaperone CopZ/ABC-type transport system involved in multi-copper enzyme maturation permease subunit